jgi:hypothetical protein
MMITNGVVEGNITINIKIPTNCLTHHVNSYKHDSTVKLSGNLKLKKLNSVAFSPNYTD